MLNREALVVLEDEIVYRWCGAVSFSWLILTFASQLPVVVIGGQRSAVKTIGVLPCFLQRLVCVASSGRRSIQIGRTGVWHRSLIIRSVTFVRHCELRFYTHFVVRNVLAGAEAVKQATMVCESCPCKQVRSARLLNLFS